MPKTILEKIKAIQSEPNFDELNSEIQPLVLEMILSLIKDPKWMEFISHFVDNDNPDQIARLTLKDNLGNDPYIKQTVAYLFTNSMCGGTTVDRLHEHIDNLLDVGINLKT